MAVPTTLHIMLCAPSRRGLGGAGSPPCRGSGGEGVGGGWGGREVGGEGRGGGEGGSPRHCSLPPPRCCGAAEGVHRPATLGGVGVPARHVPPLAGRGGGRGRGRGVKIRRGGGRASAISPAGLPSDRTPGSGRFEHNLHPAAPPPRRRIASHARAWASLSRRGSCGGGRGAHEAGSTAHHKAYTRGMEASTSAAATRASLGGARGLTPRRRHRTEPSWVIPTQWPPEPSASSSPT